MIACPYCQHENPDAQVFCEACGQNIWDYAAEETIIQKLPDNFQKMNIKSGFGTSTFEAENQVILHVREVPEPIFIQISKEVLLGRYDGIPGVDLSGFGGLEKGVSRTHAALRRGDDMLFLVDLNSTNGTFLNDQPLSPNQPRVLRSGDQVRLGQLVMHVYFSMK